MLEQIAKRLAEYIFANHIGPEKRIFPVFYSTMRALIRCLAAKFHVKILPHDFRRHSATYASRNGVPLEIVSKVLLRHHDLKTIQIYLAKLTIPRRSGGGICFTGSRIDSVFGPYYCLWGKNSD